MADEFDSNAFTEIQNPDGTWRFVANPNGALGNVASPLNYFSDPDLIDSNGNMSAANRSIFEERNKNKSSGDWFTRFADSGGLVYAMMAGIGAVALGGAAAGGALASTEGLGVGAEAYGVGETFGNAYAGNAVASGAGSELTGQSLANMLSGVETTAPTTVSEGVVTDTVTPNTPAPQTGEQITRSLEPPTNQGEIPTTPSPGAAPSSPSAPVEYDMSNPPQATATYNGNATPESPGLLRSVMDFANENRALTTAGTTIAGQLITGLGAPALARSTAEAKARADAEAAMALEQSRRIATSNSGVGFRVTPTGKLLRSPGIIGSRV